MSKLNNFQLLLCVIPFCVGNSLWLVPHAFLTVWLLSWKRHWARVRRTRVDRWMCPHAYFYDYGDSW